MKLIQCDRQGCGVQTRVPEDENNRAESHKALDGWLSVALQAFHEEPTTTEPELEGVMGLPPGLARLLLPEDNEVTRHKDITHGIFHSFECLTTWLAVQQQHGARVEG